MFTRKLCVLLSFHERLLYSRLSRASFILKINLTLASSTFNNFNAFLKNDSKFNVIRHKSNILEAASKNDDDHSDNDVHDGKDDYDENGKRITENSYAYALLKNSEKYKDMIRPAVIPDENVTVDQMNAILQKSYEETIPSEVLNDFRLLSCYSKLNPDKEILGDEKYIKILEMLKSYLLDYTNDDLQDILCYIEMWFPMRYVKSEAYSTLIIALDREYFLRINDWETEDLLKLCDLWFRVHQSQKGGFGKKALKKIGNKIKKFKAEHYLQFMFLINVRRESCIDMYELEYALEKFIPHFNANELGIIAMSFFKTRTPIRNPTLLHKIIRQTITDINEVHDISLCAIFKIIRYSIQLNTLDIVRELLRAFRHKVKKVSPMCMVHVAHTASSLLIYEKDLMDDIIEAYEPHVSKARIKHLERMLFSLTVFDYPKETPIYNKIIEELRNPIREEELKRFPKCLSRSLMYLSQVEIYPFDMIKNIMKPEYVQEVYHNNAYLMGREYLAINYNLEIDQPEYKGPFMPEKAKKYVTKRWSADFIDPESNENVPAHEKFTFEVVNYLRDIVGAENFFATQLLPHHQKTDIILCLNSSNNFVPARTFFPDIESVGVVKYAPKDPEEHKWLALILANRNMIFRATCLPTGMQQSKLRQLKKIGYTPIGLYINHWSNIKSLEGRKNYLRSILYPKTFHRKFSINNV